MPDTKLTKLEKIASYTDGTSMEMKESFSKLYEDLDELRYEIKT